MNVEYINNSRSRMVEHPYLLNMFDLGLETINRLGISVDALKRYKNNNHWRIYADILKHSGIFDAGSIPPRATSIEFLVDYFHIYHYDI